MSWNEIKTRKEIEFKLKFIPESFFHFVNQIYSEKIAFFPLSNTTATHSLIQNQTKPTNQLSKQTFKNNCFCFRQATAVDNYFISEREWNLYSSSNRTEQNKQNKTHLDLKLRLFHTLNNNNSGLNLQSRKSKTKKKIKVSFFSMAPTTTTTLINGTLREWEREREKDCLSNIVCCCCCCCL